MNNYTTITTRRDGNVEYVTFCRPQVHNAFNSAMIYELIDLFGKLKSDDQFRVVVLSGEGKSYCAGADLNWMREVKGFTYEQNLKESLALADMLQAIYSCPKPTIGRINGAAIGGGTGLVAVTDIAIAAERAVFSFSEVKIGVVPACISPYVIKRVGEGKARELFLSGERMTSARALSTGLVNHVVPEDELDRAVNKMIKQLLSSGPAALGVCKELIQKVPGQSVDEYKKYTAEVIARLRMSDEAQEGMDAFLNKRKPNWIE
jgi:methylglutaconyl-CoA hydratase